MVKADIRSELEDSNESLGKKVRQAKVDKVPYWIVIGDKEVESKTVTLESRDHGQLGAVILEDLLSKLETEIKEKN